MGPIVTHTTDNAPRRMSHTGPCHIPAVPLRRRLPRPKETGTMQRIHIIGGGLAGFTAAITAAEAGALVTVHEAHHTLGGRARTAEGPYRTNDGPHALYRRGPHWTWLAQRGLLGPTVTVPLRQAGKLRFRLGRRPAPHPAPRPPPADPPPGRTRPRRHRLPHLGDRLRSARRAPARPRTSPPSRSTTTTPVRSPPRSSRSGCAAPPHCRPRPATRSAAGRRSSTGWRRAPGT